MPQATKSAATSRRMLSQPSDVIYRVKRGLSAYVSYLAACEMNQAFSEYILYEPILRILNSQGFEVECEYECPGIEQPAKGDKKRLDFYATLQAVELAIEVKWAKNSAPDIKRDIEKLDAIQRSRRNCLPLLCIFGRKSHLENIRISGIEFFERGRGVYAELGKTRYGCRVFQFRSSSALHREA